MASIMDDDFAGALRRHGPDSIQPTPTLAAASRYCRGLALRHYENFTVASLFLPRPLVRHFHAIYSWCRWADDLADEAGGGQRALDLLAWWREELLRSYDGKAHHPVLVALRETCQRFAIPPRPFLDLLTAFEQDQRVKRYETYADLLAYCRHSANPVGHLVLYLCGSYDAERAALSDHICTALQLANFWQDVARDFEIGRVYLPAEDCRRFAYAPEDLEARRCTPAFLDLMRFQVARTRELFHAGLPLVGLMPPALRLDIDLFARGGLAILNKIEEEGFNVWGRRPTLRKKDKAALVLGAVVRRQLDGAPVPARDKSRDSVHRSYAWCEQVARKQARNFYPAFRFLPPPQRRAMCALYAFLRVSDDLADETGEVEAKRRTLVRWREQLHEMMAGEYSHPLHPAFHDTIRRYDMPVAHLDAAIKGVAMDLDRTEYQTFAELKDYCYHVASVVGLSCLHIWEAASAAAVQPAISAGIAFQMTNILRDLREDAERQRIYLPCEDLERFGYGAEELRQGILNDCFRELMRFQVDRTRGYYDEARTLLPLLPPAGRAVFQMMMQTYRALLEEIVQRNFDVFRERVRIPGWRKLGLALRAIPARWGWSA